MSSSVNPKPLFLSYRRKDNELPPDEPKAEGYISLFRKQLLYELDQAGVPIDSIWIDRNELELADEFTSVIMRQLSETHIFLAVASRAYAVSGWCSEEVRYFAQRWNEVENGGRRIFRVDKTYVPDDQLPEALRGLQSIQLYERDPETKGFREFYWRGKIRRREPYAVAVRALAEAISDRLRELGLIGQTEGPSPPPPPKPPIAPKLTVFVARPAFDMQEAYDTLVRELRQRGYRVLPETDIPQLGRAAVDLIRTSLADADLSIHLVGNWRGAEPDGLPTRTVALQLAEASAEAGRRPNFRRLIWAPRVIPHPAEYRNQDQDHPYASEKVDDRDPLEVLARFDAALASDDILGDTLARFNDFLFQHLSAREPPPPPPPAPKHSVYVAALPADQALAVETVKLLAKSGMKPTSFPKDPSFKMASRFDNVIFCWKGADEGEVLDALFSLEDTEWRVKHPAGKLILLTFDPDNETQAAARDANSFGPAQSVVEGADLPAIVQALTATE